MQPSSVPRSAIAVGLPERYRYWSGHSRRRYLFTRTAHSAVADYEDAVILAVRNGNPVWAGDAVGLAGGAGQVDGCELFIHLLAGSAEERRRIVADLRPIRPVLALAA